MSKLRYTFKADTEEELAKIRAMEVPVMSQAIDAYYTITASSKFREMERLRAKARHDEAQALHHAEQKGEQRGEQRGMQKGMSRRSVEIARNALEMQLPVDTIQRLTGLSAAEIEELGRP